MKRAGRVSPLVILGVLGLLGILGVIIFTRSGTSPAQRVNDFFGALGSADLETIINVSTFGDRPADEMRPKWQQCLDRTTYYKFAIQIKDTTYTSDEEATVAVEIYKNIMNPGVTSTRIQVPVVKVNGEWLVDARSLSRDAYPALPR